MREYLPAPRSSGHDMMKRTATVQVNLDFADEADAVDKIRTAMGLYLDHHRALRLVTHQRGQAQRSPQLPGGGLAGHG